MSLSVSRIFFGGVLVCVSILPYQALATPPQESLFPLDVNENTRLEKTRTLNHGKVLERNEWMSSAEPALMIEVQWNQQTNQYQLASALIENSATPLLALSTRKEDPLGSFKARLVDPQTKNVLAHSAIGTGYLYRSYARGITFRFAKPEGDVLFEVYAEDAQSGVMRLVVSERLEVNSLETIDTPLPAGFEVRTMKEARLSPALTFNIYADGYINARREQFWIDAATTVQTLRDHHMPLFDQIQFNAVFAPSNQKLVRGQDWRRRDSFLGLYFPYWVSGGEPRIIYPSNESKYRRGIGLVPYDYPLVLVDSTEYWGVGNFNALTAVPNKNSRSVFLLIHELGHFFGLNEEYDSGGTELKFAPGVQEPWSQNISFSPAREKLSWREFVADDTPLPTPRSIWDTRKSFGAYVGGYAGARSGVYKPGHGCAMEIGQHFCAVCLAAIKERVLRDLGY